MEHGHVSPNLETEPSENYSAASPQDEGGVDTNIAGPSDSKESLLIKLEINQSIETQKLKNNNDNAEILEFGNNNIIEIGIQDKQNGKNHYICKFCSQVFDKHQALGGHMNGHSKVQRNLEKFGKVTTWIHATYPPPLNTTLTSEAELQGTPINGPAYNSYNHLVEVGDGYSQSSRQWTNQQSAQQMQLAQRLQIQQQQLQNYQARELQSYQALERPQNYEFPQGLQNYQTPQGLQNYHASQGSQNYQTPQGSQYYQAPQRLQNYQTPQGFQSHSNPQGSQIYQASQGSKRYQALKRSPSYQTPQRPQQQVVVDANNQQKINLNSKTSNIPTSLGPSNEQKNNSSNFQGLHFQEKAQDLQRYMLNPHNLTNGDHLIMGPFINEQLNKEYYTQFGPCNDEE